MSAIFPHVWALCPLSGWHVGSFRDAEWGKAQAADALFPVGTLDSYRVAGAGDIESINRDLSAFGVVASLMMAPVAVSPPELMGSLLAVGVVCRDYEQARSLPGFKPSFLLCGEFIYADPEDLFWEKQRNDAEDEVLRAHYGDPELSPGCA